MAAFVDVLHRPNADHSDVLYSLERKICYPRSHSRSGCSFLLFGNRLPVLGRGGLGLTRRFCSRFSTKVFGGRCAESCDIGSGVRIPVARWDAGTYSRRNVFSLPTLSISKTIRR